MEKVKFYATKWCPDCMRARRLLERLKIEFEMIDIDQDAVGRDYVVKVNHGNRSVPTILFPDGSILVEPSDQELQEQILKIFGEV